MSRDDSIESLVRSFANRLAMERVGQFEDEFHDAGLLADGASPIEQRMGAALLYAIKSREHFGDGESEFFIIDPGRHAFEDLVFSDKPSVTKNIDIYPQLPVGKYKADFFVRFDGWLGGRAIGVIECDGHDFHERTKEQAKRDKERDRYFQSLGLLVLRYTGSEIYRDPLRCALDALNTFEKRVEATSRR
jgi:very-short-patch-repair endonuclease